MTDSMEGRLCLECFVPLKKRLCSYMPGGRVYFCSRCRHEYTVYEYHKLLEDMSESEELMIGMTTLDTESKVNEIDLKVKEFSQDSDVVLAINKLLEEGAVLEDTNSLVSYDEPIQKI